MESIDFSVPRERIYRDVKGQPGPCPNCNGNLIKHYAMYYILTYERGIPADELMTGNDMGWFCDNCPVVVIDVNTLKRVAMVQSARPDWTVGSEIDVVGIINREAIPANKRHLPIGSKNNPVPLVRFSNCEDKNDHGKSSTSHDMKSKGEIAGSGGKKLGTEKHPAIVRVQTQKRAEEIMRLCNEKGWIAIVGIEPDKPENISDLERLMNRPAQAKKWEKVPRNAPCPCGSGNKFKKCCLGKE